MVNKSRHVFARTIRTGSPASRRPDSSAEVVGASPSTRVGGFPMILFAHGYHVTPDTYAALLDSWVERGFVVAAPIFADENSSAITLQHHVDTEGDLVNEPADLAFVTHHLIQDSAAPTPSCPLINGLIDPTSLALAGHSDGGEAVGMLSNSLGRDPRGSVIRFAPGRSRVSCRCRVVVLSCCRAPRTTEGRTGRP